MKTIFTLVLIGLGLSSPACSGYTKPFCVTHAERPSHPVIKGAVIASGTHSIQMEVLEVIHGTETRSVITVWDMPNINCNGIIPMNAQYVVGSVGDTVIAILPPITTAQNAWDVVGDYSTPYWLFYFPVLKVKNNWINGYINGSQSPNWYVNSMSYPTFKNYWTQHQGDCTTLVGLAEGKSLNEPHLLQTENAIQIYFQEKDNYSARIVSLQGQTVAEYHGSGDLLISTTDLPPAIYVLWLRDEKGQQHKYKLVR